MVIAALASLANFALVIGMFVVLPIVGSAILLYRYFT